MKIKGTNARNALTLLRKRPTDPVHENRVKVTSSSIVQWFSLLQCRKCFLYDRIHDI
jgi:hypothetical protein